MLNKATNLVVVMIMNEVSRKELYKEGELLKDRKPVDKERLGKIRKTETGIRADRGMEGFGLIGDVDVDSALARVNRASFTAERDEILKVAKEGEEGTDLKELMVFIETEEARRESFKFMKLGEFEVGEEAGAREKRSLQIIELLGAGYLQDALIEGKHWVEGEDEDGLFGEKAWSAAEKLIKGVDLDELEDEEYNAWVYLKAWGEVLEDGNSKKSEPKGKDPRKTLIEFQAMLKTYGIEAGSILSKDGVIKFEDGKTLEDKLDKLDELEVRSKGLLEAKKEGLLEEEEIGEVNLGEIIRKLGEWQVGRVAEAYLNTKMGEYLNADMAGSDQLPVKWTLSETGDKEGLVFTNVWVNKNIQFITMCLGRAGFQKKWEDIGRLAVSLNIIKEGFNENRLEKAELAKLATLAPASMMLTLAETVPGFAEVVMHGALTGVRHGLNGEPTKMIFDKDDDGNVIGSRIPENGEEKVEPLLLGMNPGIRKNLAEVLIKDEDFQKKIEEKGEKFQPWAVELAYSFLWAIGEGIEIPWTLTKIRSAEELIFSVLGANVQIFYEWPGAVEAQGGVLRPGKAMHETLAEIDEENEWEAGTANEQATKILRWLTPAIIPYGTHLTEVLKFMSINPMSQDTIYSLFWGKMPVYDDLTKIELKALISSKELPVGTTIENITDSEWIASADLPEEVKESDEYKRLVMMRDLEFSGPLADIEEQFKREILLRERRRWQAVFGLVHGTGSKLRGRGVYDRVHRFLFDVENTSHVRFLISEINKSEDGAEKDKLNQFQEKLRVLNFTSDDDVTEFLKFDEGKKKYLKIDKKDIKADDKIIKHFKVDDETIEYLFKNEEAVQNLANEIHQRLGWDLNINEDIVKVAIKEDEEGKLAKNLVEAKLKALNFKEDIEDGRGRIKEEAIEYLFKNEEAVKDLAEAMHQEFKWGLNISKDKARRAIKEYEAGRQVKLFVKDEFDDKSEERDKFFKAVKLELALRDLGSWGHRADFREDRPEKGSWRDKLLDKASSMRGSLDALHYKWAYNYTIYKLLSGIMIDWPEMSVIDGITKILEKLRGGYFEYGKRTGMRPHVSDTVKTMHMFLTAAAALNEISIGSGQNWIKKPEDALKKLSEKAKEHYPDQEDVPNIKYFPF